MLFAVPMNSIEIYLLYTNIVFLILSKQRLGILVSDCIFPNKNRFYHKQKEEYSDISFQGYTKHFSDN